MDRTMRDSQWPDIWVHTYNVQERLARPKCRSYFAYYWAWPIKESIPDRLNSLEDINRIVRSDWGKTIRPTYESPNRAAERMEAFWVTENLNVLCYQIDQRSRTNRKWSHVITEGEAALSAPNRHTTQCAIQTDTELSWVCVLVLYCCIDVFWLV